MNQLYLTARMPSINVNRSKNATMNKSAILMNKFEIQLAQELPKYVTGSRRGSRIKSITINKGIQSLGVKNKTIHKILQASIKEAMKTQQSFKNIAESRKKIRKSQRTTQIIKPYPRSILNLLYRQNIKNYNPYVETLTQIEDMTTITDQQKDRIQKLCYAGIARNYFRMKKYYDMPHYSRVGVLIRTYMVDVMRENLEQKIQSQPHSVYIQINQTALSFNPYDRPKQLEQHISKKKYTQIIRGANKIIEIEYEKYKKSSFQFIKSNMTFSQVLMYVVIAIIVAILVIWTPQQGSFLGYIGFAGILLVAFGGMGLSWIQCKNNLGKVCAPNNITSKIQERLKNFFKSLSDDTLTWKVGPDFYWIQIENIKIRKRKNQGDLDNDNF